MEKFDSLSHVRWECKYHVVFIPKYRRKVIYGKLRAAIGPILRDLCRQKEVEVLEGHAMSDHIHLCLKIPPKYSVSYIVCLFRDLRLFFGGLGGQAGVIFRFGGGAMAYSWRDGANGRRDLGKERRWRGVLARYASSGLGVREFCRREGLAESAFYAWRRTIQERDGRSGSGTSNGRRAQPSAKSGRRAEAPAFVPAIVTEEAPAMVTEIGTEAPPPPALSIELSGGCVLRFVGPLAAEPLADLVLALQARCGR